AATLPEKWHVYADSVADLELGGLDISWANDKMQKDGKAIASPAATIIKDQVFENRELRVYTGNFTLTQKINISGEVPASLKIILHGFASNDETFVPLEETRNISFEGGVAPVAASRIKLQGVNL